MQAKRASVREPNTQSLAYQTIHGRSSVIHGRAMQLRTSREA